MNKYGLQKQQNEVLKDIKQANFKMYTCYLPESSTTETELAGLRINVNVVSVVLDDFITGRGKLLATIVEYRHIHKRMYIFLLFV